MRNALLLLATLTAALCAPAAMGQNLFKCVDDKGHATYSDRACAQAPRPAPPATRPTATMAPVAKASAPSAAAATASTAKPEPITKLTAAAVEGVLQRAVDMGDRKDYRGQCALAAPDLNFKLTDHSSNPPSVYSGGRGDICALQQQSAQAMQAGGLRSSTRMNKLDIRVSADGTQATAKYESAAAISVEGQHALTMQCSREEVLGLYSGVVQYKRVSAVCRPV